MIHSRLLNYYSIQLYRLSFQGIQYAPPKLARILLFVCFLGTFSRLEGAEESKSIAVLYNHSSHRASEKIKQNQRIIYFSKKIKSLKLDDIKEYINKEDPPKVQNNKPNRIFYVLLKDKWNKAYTSGVNNPFRYPSGIEAKDYYDWNGNENMKFTGLNRTNLTKFAYRSDKLITPSTYQQSKAGSSEVPIIEHTKIIKVTAFPTSILKKGFLFVVMVASIVVIYHLFLSQGSNQPQQGMAIIQDK